MKQTLVLTLTGEQVTLEVVKPAAAPGLRGFRGAFLRLRKLASPSTTLERVACVEHLAQITSDSLPSALEQVWTLLRNTYSASVDGSGFEVHVGLAHARLGLLVLADTGAKPLTASALDAYAKAWVRQMWDIDPTTQIIKWQALEDKNKLLISCVDRQVFDGLAAFSHRHSLQFVSCKPALLTALKTYNDEKKTARSNAAITGATTLVWTEASSLATRSSVVQLLRYEGAHLQALWRGWLTPPIAPDGPDDVLDGAIRRFLASNNAQPGDTLRRHHWPALTSGSSIS